jgi:hypothetical protein
MRTTIASCAVVAVAALLATPTISVAQTPMGDAPICLKSASGSTSCVYRTMTDCQQAKLAGSADQCLDKSQAGATTGAGGAMSPPPSPPPSPAR